MDWDTGETSNNLITPADLSGPNILSELPTRPYLMLNYLQLRWRTSLTDASLIECCSTSWWVCNLAPCLSLPLCLEWHCKNPMVLKLRHKSNLCLSPLLSASQYKSFLRLLNAFVYTLLCRMDFSRNVNTVDSVRHHRTHHCSLIQLLCRAPHKWISMAGV